MHVKKNLLTFLSNAVLILFVIHTTLGMMSFQILSVHFQIKIKRRQNMDEHQVVWNEKVAEKIIKNLEKRRMTGSYTANAAAAKDEILEMIPQGATVFRCGSMTAGGMGLWEGIAAIPGVNLIDPYTP